MDEKEFYKKLTEFPNRTIYIQLEGINETIVGRPTGGSINVDGASAVRRSCNLSMISNNVNLNEKDWVFGTQFTLSIGLLNEFYGMLDYPFNDQKIIWFPQGKFIITQFSAQLNTNSYTLNISGQDKMCLLNGEVSGALTSEIDFGKYDYIDEEGKKITKYLTIREILINILQVYAKETANSWYIDIPDNSGLELLEYKGNDPLYLFLRKEEDGYYNVENVSAYGTQTGYIKINNENEYTQVQVQDLPRYWTPKSIIDNSESLGTEFRFAENTDPYQVRKLKYGEIAGYKVTDLIYANGELIANAGETITSILDKIKNMLGDFEYYYDIEGKFHFEPKKIYLKTLWNEEGLDIPQDENEQYIYTFEDFSLFTSFSNTPDLKNLKNDFTIHGARKSVTGTDLPIHMRLAIDKKPEGYYSPWQNITYKAFSEIEEGEEVKVVDWRELIYQMAADYYAHGQEADFESKLAAGNSDLVSGGRTGYEQYYTDLLGFWRQLYDPSKTNDVSYERSYFNDELATWYYGWELCNPKNIEGISGKTEVKFVGDISKTIVELKDLYIDLQDENESTKKIKWINSLNLSPTENEYFILDDNGNRQLITRGKGLTNPLSLRKLYVQNSSTGNYELLLNTKNFKEQTYYTKSEDETSFIPLSKNEYWDAIKNIERLYYKKIGQNWFQPLVEYNDVRRSIGTTADVLLPYLNIKIAAGQGLKGKISFSYSDRLRLQALKFTIAEEETVIKFDSNFTWNENNLKEFYTKWNTKGMTLQYQLINDNAETFHDFNIECDILYFCKKQYLEDEEGYSLYIDVDNTKMLYVNYLATIGTFDKRVIDEFNLYIQKPIIDNSIEYYHLIESIPINRSNLLIKENNSNEESYIPFYQYAASLRMLPNQVYSKTDLKQLGPNTPKTQFEYYKATNYKGELIGNNLERLITYYQKVYEWNDDGWNRKIEETPEILNFWFEFIEPKEGTTTEDLLRYSVRTIGSRNFVKKEESVTAIVYLETPTAYYGKTLQLPQYYADNYFTIATTRQSAKNAIDTKLYNHTYITESITITSIPIYYLEPNTKIQVRNKEFELNEFEDYIVDKLTIPLAYNGMMTINATKAPPKSTITTD